MKISENQTYLDMSGRRVFVATRAKLSNRSGGQDKFWTYMGYQVDREGNRIGEPRGWKSDGRDWTGDMHGNILREAETGMSLSVAQGVILERLIEAIDTDMALPIATGPKMFGNAWPDSVSSEDDNNEMQREEDRDWKTFQTRQRHQAIDQRTERRAKCSRTRISRMEEAFAWLRAIFDEDDRRLLLAYAEVKAKGWEWGRYVETRNRRNPQKDAWVRRTILRKIAKTLQELEAKMRNSATILRDCAGLQVAHEAAKHTGKSITSGLPTWPEPEEQPALRRTA